DLRGRAADAATAGGDERDASLESHGGGSVPYSPPTTRRRAMDIPDGWGLDGKVALVTGGGAAGGGIGNGRAAAILLAKAGARVAAADRDPKHARRTGEMIEPGAAKASPSDVDVPRSS